MPLYEYRCDDCDEEFAAFRSPEARRNAPCPSCGRRAKKLLKPVGIIFKGSGFHATDYRKPEPKQDGEKPQPALSGSEKKETGEARGER